MTKKDYDAFIKAVDVVCINCVGISEKNCKGCPVRKSVNHHRKQLSNEVCSH